MWSQEPWLSSILRPKLGRTQYRGKDIDGYARNPLLSVYRIQDMAEAGASSVYTFYTKYRTHGINW